MKEILIKKTQASLKNIESIIPTPEGDLHVKWNFSGGELELVIPAEMVVKLDLESLDISDTTGVKLDGKVLDSKSVSQQFVSLLKGKHKIEF